MRRRSRAGGEPVKTRTGKTAARKRGDARKADSERRRLQEQLDLRTQELREALERQAATAEVLSVISSSPGELDPVFQSVLENATRLCDAKFGMLYRCQNERFRLQASYNAPPGLIEHQRKRGFFAPRPGAPLNHLLQTRAVVHSHDPAIDPAESPSVKLGGSQSSLAVPMFKDAELVGAIFIYHQEKRPFTQKHVALVTNFAAQAIIAIENTRLLNELRQRTDDLTESLEQQTATSEVLKVISSSPGDLEPVFQAMLENATRICEAEFGHFFLSEGDDFRVVALQSAALTYPGWLKRGSKLMPLDNPHGPLAQLARTKKIVHIADLAAEQAYIERNARMVALVEFSGARTFLGVPMFKEGALIGVIAIYRQEVRPFTDKQIELVKNFAAQAVIAIENTRLLNELRELLEQQTATSEVLKVISGSPGELQPVFHAMLENATRICEASFGNLLLREGDTFRRVASHNAPPNFATFIAKEPLIHRRQSHNLNRLIETKQAGHVADIAADEPETPIVKFGGARTLVAVPMLKENELIGAFAIYRQEVRPFTDKQIELLKNFAAQAVIAIENARLLNELRQRTDDLTESLQQQTATSEILDVISNSPTDSQPAFDAIVRSGLKLFPEAAIMIGLPDGDLVSCAAVADADPAGAEALCARMPLPLTREFITSTAILDRREVDLPDAREAPAELAAGARNFLASGYRAMTVIPMMRGELAIGTVNVMRRRPGPLSDKERELLRIFANQAVIAIENARLLNELRELLQQQTATADVLKVISRNPECVCWVGEWSVCSGAMIWTRPSAISIYTIGLVAQAVILRRHSVVWS